MFLLDNRSYKNINYDYLVKTTPKDYPIIICTSNIYFKMNIPKSLASHVSVSRKEFPSFDAELRSCSYYSFFDIFQHPIQLEHDEQAIKYISAGGKLNGITNIDLAQADRSGRVFLRSPESWLHCGTGEKNTQSENIGKALLFLQYKLMEFLHRGNVAPVLYLR